MLPRQQEGLYIACGVSYGVYEGGVRRGMVCEGEQGLVGWGGAGSGEVGHC